MTYTRLCIIYILLQEIFFVKEKISLKLENNFFFIYKTFWLDFGYNVNTFTFNNFTLDRHV